MTKSYFLISAFGKDRPGMVAGLTEVLFQLGGNILDASMTRLGGEFSIMLVVSLPSSVRLPKVQAGFKKAEKRFGLQLTAKSITQALAKGGQRTEPHYLLSVYGTDRAGIVYQVTNALAERRVNITDLQTKAITRTGSPLYVMLLEIQVPPAADIDDLRSALDSLRQSLQVEITLQDIEPVAL